jgi:hypothetical protein
VYDMAYFERLFPGRTIDLNVGLIREQLPGVFHVKQTIKGAAAFSHQIVWSTARAPTPLTCALETRLSADDMVRGVTTHTLRYLEDLLGPDVYERERPHRLAAFHAQRTTAYALVALRLVTVVLDTPEWRDAIKSLTLKLAQVKGEHSLIARFPPPLHPTSFRFAQEGPLWCHL